MSGAATGEPRWLVRRRAEAAAAMVRTEAAPAEQACLRYGVSIAQFEGFRRASDRWAARRAGWSFGSRSA